MDARATPRNVDNAEHRAVAEPNTILLGLQVRLESLLQDSPLPDRPAYDAVNAFLSDTYRSWWSRADAAA
jgi:hypothetical protein